jgi:branched-chain amino acid transport system permease protein
VSAATRIDWAPPALILGLAAGALPLIGDPAAWLTLTVAALAMGMMIFVMSSGLTLVFGLMDVINFGHGVFISIGAYVALLVLVPLAAWSAADSLALNLAVAAIAAARSASPSSGW